MLKWVHQHKCLDFEAMTDMESVIAFYLASEATSLPEVIEDQLSADGTRKWLVRVDSGNAVEMVFIPDGDRGTLCVSSQAGCALNCSFCSTASRFQPKLELLRSSVSFGWPMSYSNVGRTAIVR